MNKEKLIDILETMKHDMKHNRQTMAADYPYMKIIEILEVLTYEKTDKETETRNIFETRSMLDMWFYRQ